jgi:hypothetical protein
VASGAGRGPPGPESEDPEAVQGDRGEVNKSGPPHRRGVGGTGRGEDTVQYSQSAAPHRPGPQPHNRIAASADEQLHRALVDLPSDQPSESWLGRHTAALESYVAGDGLDQWAKVESQMSGELMLMLQTANQLYPETLRAILRDILFADDGFLLRELLREALHDVATGLLDDVNTDVQDLAAAVVALESGRAVAA